MRRSLRAIVATSAVAAVAFGSLLTASAAQAARTTPSSSGPTGPGPGRPRPVPERLQGPRRRGCRQGLRQHPGRSRKVTVESAAPDVVIGANDWVGELAANGSIVKINLSTKAKAALEAGAVQAFNYNGTQYGVPVAVENIALITNSNLIKTQPKTFDAAPSRGTGLKKAGKVDHPAGRPAGCWRRRVPHVPAVLWPRRLHLRHHGHGPLQHPEHRHRQHDVPRQPGAHRRSGTSPA